MPFRIPTPQSGLRRQGAWPRCRPCHGEDLERRKETYAEISGAGGADRDHVRARVLHRPTSDQRTEEDRAGPVAGRPGYHLGDRTLLATAFRRRIYDIATYAGLIMSAVLDVHG